MTTSQLRLNPFRAIPVAFALIFNVVFGPMAPFLQSQLTGPTSALAYVGDASGTFELDGNAYHADTGHDWDQVYADRNGPPFPASAANNVVFVDDITGAGDDILTGGSTKDIYDLPSWLWKQSCLDIGPGQGRHRERLRGRVHGLERPHHRLLRPRPVQHRRRRDRRVLVLQGQRLEDRQRRVARDRLQWRAHRGRHPGRHRLHERRLAGNRHGLLLAQQCADPQGFGPRVRRLRPVGLRHHEHRPTANSPWSFTPKSGTADIFPAARRKKDGSAGRRCALRGRHRPDGPWPRHRLLLELHGRDPLLAGDNLDPV